MTGNALQAELKTGWSKAIFPLIVVAQKPGQGMMGIPSLIC